MSNSNIPYIVEGEILNVNFPGEEEEDDELQKEPISFNFITYECSARLPGGTTIILPRVVEGSLFGGIDDYFQTRRYATHLDAEYNIGDFFESENTADLNATIGERVYIAFINGDILRPVIISHMQHPKQVSRFSEDEDRLNPQTYLRHLGMEVFVSDTGNMTMTHNGAPTIKHAPSGSALGELVGAAVGAVTGAVSGASSDATAEPSSPSVEPNENYPDCKTLMEFLDLGEWRVRDSLGQMIEIDPDVGHIYISDNGIKSTDDINSDIGLNINTNSTDAEYVLLDRDKEMVLINARKIAQIYSFDRRKDVTEGDHSHKIGGDEKITIEGDKTDTVDGNVTRTVKSDLEENISGGVTWTVDGDWDETVSGDFTSSVEGSFALDVTGDWEIDSSGDFTILAKGDLSAKTQAGAGMVVSGGTVEVGSSVAGIFATVSDLMEQLDAVIKAILQMTFATSVGPTSPGPIVPVDFLQAQAKIQVLKQKLDSVKGSV